MARLRLPAAKGEEKDVPQLLVHPKPWCSATMAQNGPTTSTFLPLSASSSVLEATPPTLMVCGCPFSESARSGRPSLPEDWKCNGETSCGAVLPGMVTTLP